MEGNKVRKIGSAGVRLAVLSAALLLCLGAAGAVDKPAAAGVVKGALSDQDWNGPVENVVVRILDTNTGKEYLSAPTDDRGKFEITGVPEGRYRVEVVSAEGAADLKQSVLVKAGEVAEMSLGVGGGALTPQWEVAQGVNGIMEIMCPPPKKPSPWKPPGKPPWPPGPPPWHHHHHSGH